jgi:uncharacterized protein
MRISDRHNLRVCCAAAAMLAAVSAHAFEARERTPDGAPASALPALPAPAVPALPNLGVDEGMRKVLQSFRQSYASGDKSAALKQLETAAGQGNVAARWKAARMLADGDGVTRDDYRAFRHFKEIVDGYGSEGRDSLNGGAVSDSLVALGVFWRNGIKASPIRQNNAEALRVFTEAAIYHANAEAQYQLGVMWLDGSAGTADPIRAARWLNLSAEKGHGEAQAVLGRMLFLGESMPRQAWRGLMWLQLARDNTRAASTGWVREMHEKAFAAASEEERRMAQRQAERFMRASERR